MIIKLRLSRKKRIVIKPSMVFLHIFMIILVAFTALPIVYVVSTAFKPLDELFLFPPRFLVRRPTLKNFIDLTLALEGMTVPFLRYVFNSLLTTIITVICTVVVSSMGAYSLVKHKPPGAETIFNIILAALMFSPHVTRNSAIHGNKLYGASKFLFSSDIT